jgi:translation initiation factor IF-3
VVIGKELRVNERIRVSPIRLIGEEGEQLGVVLVEAALQQAREAGLDLVEVAPTASPPVCKLMDYGKFKYQQRKRDQQAKHRHAGEMKSVQLGPRTEEHDLQFKLRKAREFLAQGQRVQIYVRFRGAQMRHVELGDQLLRRCVETLADVAKTEEPIKMEARRMSVTLGLKPSAGATKPVAAPSAPTASPSAPVAPPSAPVAPPAAPVASPSAPAAPPAAPVAPPAAPVASPPAPVAPPAAPVAGTGGQPVPA